MQDCARVEFLSFWDALRGIPPSPLVYWNLRVSVKIVKNPRAATTCGQNLEPQGVRQIASGVKELV